MQVLCNARVILTVVVCFYLHFFADAKFKCTITVYKHPPGNVRVKSNRDQAPPGQPPGNLTFEKIIGQMPSRTGRNHSQMPCYRGSPGSGILAKIKFNKYFKIKKNEK